MKLTQVYPFGGSEAFLLSFISQNKVKICQNFILSKCLLIFVMFLAAHFIVGLVF